MVLGIGQIIWNVVLTLVIQMNGTLGVALLEILELGN